MPPIEIGGPTGPQAPRPIGTLDSRSTRAAGDAIDGKVAARPSGQAQAAATVVRSDALDAGAEPVDGERVAEIRRAIERGSYPVIPMRVTDAMIAAGMLLRSGK